MAEKDEGTGPHGGQRESFKESHGDERDFTVQSIISPAQKSCGRRMEVDSLSTGRRHPRYSKLEGLETHTHPALTWLHDVYLVGGRALFSGWQVSMLVLVLFYGEKGLRRGKYNVSNQTLILYWFVYGQHELRRYEYPTCPTLKANVGNLYSTELSLLS